MRHGYVARRVEKFVRTAGTPGRASRRGVGSRERVDRVMERLGRGIGWMN